MSTARWYRWDDDRLIVDLKILTRSARTATVGVRGDALVVKIKSPPVDGRANAELIGYLAKRFGIGKRDVQILRGAGARRKTVALETPVTLPEELHIAGR